MYMYTILHAVCYIIPDPWDRSRTPPSCCRGSGASPCSCATPSASSSSPTRAATSSLRARTDDPATSSHSSMSQRTAGPPSASSPSTTAGWPGTVDSGLLADSVGIPAMDPDPELDFLLFGDSGSGFRFSKKQNCITYRSVTIPALESNFLAFCRFWIRIWIQ